MNEIPLRLYISRDRNQPHLRSGVASVRIRVPNGHPNKQQRTILLARFPSSLSLLSCTPLPKHVAVFVKLMLSVVKKRVVYSRGANLIL